MVESDAVTAANRLTAGSPRARGAVTEVQPSDGRSERGRGVDRNGRRCKQEETFKLCAVKNAFDGTSSAITSYFCSHTCGDKSLARENAQALSYPRPV